VVTLVKKKAMVSSMETNKPPNVRAQGVEEAWINAEGKKAGME
jgi:hypothetical protein